jgi:hypothetical protein
MKTGAHELNREFSKKEVQMASKYMKKCSTSFLIKELQTKTTLKRHFIPIRMATNKGNNNHRYW